MKQELGCELCLLMCELPQQDLGGLLVLLTQWAVFPKISLQAFMLLLLLLLALSLRVRGEMGCQLRLGLPKLWL